VAVTLIGGGGRSSLVGFETAPIAAVDISIIMLAMIMAYLSLMDLTILAVSP
jgi:hypothetical protein